MSEKGDFIVQVSEALKHAIGAFRSRQCFKMMKEKERPLAVPQSALVSRTWPPFSRLSGLMGALVVSIVSTPATAAVVSTAISSAESTIVAVLALLVACAALMS